MAIAGAAYGASKALEEIMAEQMLRAQMEQRQKQAEAQLALQQRQMEQRQKQAEAQLALQQRQMEGVEQDRQLLRELQTRDRDLAAQKYRDEQAAEATDRNIGLDASNVLNMPGMTDEAKANELRQSALRNPKASSATGMLKIVEGLSKKPEQVQYTHTDPKTGRKTLRFAPKDQIPEDGLDLGNEPPTQKPDVEVLTPGGLDVAARQYAMTGSMPPMGMGAAEVRARIINRAAELYPDLNIASSQSDFASDKGSLTSVTKMMDAVTAYENTATKNLGVMQELAKKIPDTGSPVLNRPLRAINQQALGSEELAAFNAARTVVIPEFARIISNPNLTGVLTNEQRKEVDEMLSGNMSINQMMAVARVLQQDAANRKLSLTTQRDVIRGRIAPGNQPAGEPPPGRTNETGGGGGGETKEQRAARLLKQLTGGL